MTELLIDYTVRQHCVRPVALGELTSEGSRFGVEGNGE